MEEIRKKRIALKRDVAQVKPMSKWKDSRAMPEKLGGVERTGRKRRIVSKREQIELEIAWKCDRLSKTERAKLRKKFLEAGLTPPM